MCRFTYGFSTQQNEKEVVKREAESVKGIKLTDTEGESWTEQQTCVWSVVAWEWLPDGSRGW